MKWYSDEFLTTLLSEETWSTVAWSGTLSWNSLVVRGTIRPSVSASYDLRMTSHPEAEFYFDGDLVGGSLRPAGDCLPSSPTSVTAAARDLEAGEDYAYEIRLRTGCGLYDEAVVLEWRELPSGDWATVPASVLWSCPVAVPWATVPASVLRTCSLTGVCDTGWTGEQCDQPVTPIPLLGLLGLAVLALLLLLVAPGGLRALSGWRAARP